jgi:glycosyltransferase involved in cell wall biosynthesis
VTLVHVTHFNSVMWDTGTTRSMVVEHGIVDPGRRYTGELRAAAVVVMQLGTPVVALASTEACEAVPPEAGVCSTDPARLRAALRECLTDTELAHRRGRAARDYALERYGLGRFLDDWDQVLDNVCRTPQRRPARAVAESRR